MRRMHLKLAAALLVGVLLSVIIANQTAHPSRAAETPTPPSSGTATTSGSMTISGQVPAPAGTSVTVEVLDPSTLQPTQCSSTTSTGGTAGTSDFTVTVSSKCVQGVSGNLRICWAEGQCSAAVFQPGDISVGMLSSDVVQGVPEGGSGVQETPAATRALPSTGHAGSVSLSGRPRWFWIWPAVLGAAGLLVLAYWRLRVKTAR
jgi:hypothetical protein